MKRFKWKSRWSYHHPIDSNKKNFLLSSFSLSVCVLRARVWVCCECLCRCCRCRCRCVLHIAQCFVWTLNTNTVLKRSKNKFNLTDKHTSTVIAQPTTNAATITERTNLQAILLLLLAELREREGECMWERERESYISNCVLCLLLLRRPRLASFVLQLCVLLGASCALVLKNQLATFFSSRSVFVYHTHTHTHKCATYSWVREPAFFFVCWEFSLLRRFSVLCATKQSVSASETASARKSAPTTTITQQQRNTNTTATREGQREREQRSRSTSCWHSCGFVVLQLHRERERVSASNIHIYITYIHTIS